ncbi:MAG: CHAT domain-containing tetratricopeptide repeat protein [Candidatus Acidiferrales bacterium]
MAHRRSLHGAGVVEQLIEVARTKLRVDARQAVSLADAAVAIARQLGNREILACSFRSKANTLYNIGKNKSALRYHQQALRIFRKLGNAEQEARTLNSSIQPFILMGEYDSAMEAAQEAREIFKRLGDQRHLGHLEINIGNLWHRQDRFEEGLDCYERAYQMLLPLRDAEGLAVALYNMAVCLISLNDFPRALASYERAREMFVRHGMSLLVTQSDYNIAYLYYLRGEYSRAIEMLRSAREASEKNEDTHIAALCYLDLSEIYLELNLTTEARETAHEGYRRFQKLGMGYEEAKCQAYEAMAYSQLQESAHSLKLFSQARTKFVRERNLVWPSLLDLYRAVVLFNEGRLAEARHLCSRADVFFARSSLRGKAVLCQLLLARLSLCQRDITTARKRCVCALGRLAGLDFPVLHYQAHFLMSQIQRACCEHRAAYDSCQKAREALETLRGGLQGDELRISFMKNRLEVYESLIDLCLSDPGRTNSAEESFAYIELAKSRSLAELLMQPGHLVPSAEEGQSDLLRRIRDMREQLNWYYRRIEIEQLKAEPLSPERVGGLQKQALDQENKLLCLLRELPRPETPSSEDGGFLAGSLENVRACLPPGAVLVEYFSLQGKFVAAVVARDGLQFFPVAPVSRVANLVGLLRFQISKFRLGDGYVREFYKTIFDTTKSHLRELYRELLEPLRERLQAEHLIIVPHGILHYVPFHALFAGNAYLMDSFTISYAPSAGIYALCQQKKPPVSGPPLVLGVPDSRAPYIQNEVESVAKIFPGATLVVGAESAEMALRTEGPQSCLIHIATHGSFRQDNPMFSGIRLGSGYLNLYDLYQLKFKAELVTLSGCATGLNVVAAGDELLGLVRGLLHAGARSLLLTLWDVHDQSATELMTSFYRRLDVSQNKALALRGAMQELRERYPHPYHWAPFTLTGGVFPN